MRLEHRRSRNKTPSLSPCSPEVVFGLPAPLPRGDSTEGGWRHGRLQFLRLGPVLLIIPVMMNLCTPLPGKSQRGMQRWPPCLLLIITTTVDQAGVPSSLLEVSKGLLPHLLSALGKSADAVIEVGPAPRTRESLTARGK